jgi:glycosyltransferase involved in cell wall biosynthesis
MRLALVCGDGLPVSGLLTVFRNVVLLGAGMGQLDSRVPADLGYSWRPDKPAFFPRGAPGETYPDWLSVTDRVPVDGGDAFAMRLVELRERYAGYAALSPAAREETERWTEELAEPYERHFTSWFDEHDPDWVCAVNMTLSDAVPVTLGLHRAAARRWGTGRPGGVLFWDHDLFGSYSVYERDQRVYPVVPPDVMPLPADVPWHRWSVVSEGLAKEASTYPTLATADYVPNVLPEVGAGIGDAHHEFLLQHGLTTDRPLILVPVRIFRVKGVEISVRLFAALRQIMRDRGEPAPCLLVFGSLGEDPEYTQDVLAVVDETGVGEDIRFLDGVPLSSHRGADGRWRLDEIDLLRLCAASYGGVFFTPNRPDVESVGLGPALAAVAGLPAASVTYTAAREMYGGEFEQLEVDVNRLDVAAAQFAGLLAANRAGDNRVRRMLEVNRQAVRLRFPEQPWRDLLHDMADGIVTRTKMPSEE